MSDKIIIDNDYTGVDISLEISLHEYGLAVAEMDKDEYHIVYGTVVGNSETGEPIWVRFDQFTLRKDEVQDLLHLLSDEDIRSLNKTCGTSYGRSHEVNDVMGVVRLLSDLFSMWGAENFFSPGWEDYEVEIIDDEKE